jgi:hypothetical protein
MKTTIKTLCAITLVAFSATNTIKSNVVENNRTAYELTALAADGYLRYKHERGASVNACSENGKRICSILNKLTQETRLFSNPELKDLKKLSQNAALAFRDFDFSGAEKDKQAFAHTLISLLQATLPLLNKTEKKECQILIKQVQATIQQK